MDDEKCKQYDKGSTLSAKACLTGRLPQLRNRDKKKNVTFARIATFVRDPDSWLLSSFANLPRKYVRIRDIPEVQNVRNRASSAFISN